MQFYRPEALMALWVLPLLLGVFMLGGRVWRSKIRRLGDENLIRQKLLPTFSPGARSLRAFYALLVFLFAVLALAQPQWGEEKKKIQRKAVDLILSSTHR